MPRKPKQSKQKITVVVNGKPISVTLHPPNDSRKSWFAYWSGANFSRSTGCSRFDDAVAVAENMVLGKGNRCQLQDAILTDEEFIEIQRRHFGKKKGDAAQARAEKSLKETLDAISAFQSITKLNPITSATPAHCESFQEAALLLPKNWRKQFPNSQDEVACLSPVTVIKWSRQLQAAWERSNRNGGRKCVRGVVNDAKLLNENPWRQFTWIEAGDRALRHFDMAELISVIDYFDENWRGVTVGALLAKVLLWSWGRRDEITSLRWDQLQSIGNEHHFHTIGKWGVQKWFRLPDGLFAELQEIRTKSQFVFAAYPQQLRKYYRDHNNCRHIGNIKEQFRPKNLADWFQHRIENWSSKHPKGPATPHVFRKTALQIARRGEDLNRQVASDAKLTESVMMANYVTLTDSEMRAASNRTFERLVRSLPPAVATLYGHVTEQKTAKQLEEELVDASQRKDWSSVAQLATELANLGRDEV